MSPAAAAAAAAIAALRESPFVEPLARVLLHSLWIDAAVAILLAAALRLMRRSSSNARYVATCAALLLCVTLPTLALLPLTTPAPHRTRTEPRLLPDTAPLLRQPITDTAALAPLPPTAPPLLRPALVAAWAVGVAILSLHQLGGWLYLQYVRRTARTPVPPEWTARLTDLAARLGVRRRVRLLDCPCLGVPAVAGALRPAFLLPVALLTGLPVDHLDAILAHELAHVRRHDYLVNLLQSVIDTLLFYHPAAWWISAQIRQEREHCCDDTAAAAVGSTVAYAQALLALESARGTTARPPTTVLPTATTGSLARRIRRLLNAPPPPRPRPDRRRSAIAAVIAAACALAPLLVARAQQRQNHPLDPQPRNPAAITEPGQTTTTTTAASPILPEDLQPNPRDYYIVPGDTVQVSIADLVVPGVETVKTDRVADQSGTISMPLVGPIKLAGLTEPEAEKAVAKSYEDKGLIRNAQVSVIVTDARGNTFSVLGAAAAPGVYPIPRGDTRLLDALALARANPARLTAITLIRRDGQRRISIPPAKAAAGDPSVNIVLRPGDTLTLTGPDPEKSYRFVRVVVENDGPRLVRYGIKSKTVDDWSAVEAAIRALPHLPDIVLELAAGSKDVTVEAYFAAQAKATDLQKKLGLAYVSNVGIDQSNRIAPPATTAPSAEVSDRDTLIEYLATFDKTMAAAVKDKQVCQERLDKCLSEGLGEKHPNVLEAKRQLDQAQARVDRQLAIQTKYHEENGRWMDGRAAADAAASRPRTSRPAVRRDDTRGFFSIGGQVPRQGTYSRTEGITLKQTLIAAGLGADGDPTITLFRRDGDRTFVTAQGRWKEFLDGRKQDVVIHANDDIEVSPVPPPPESTSRPAPAPLPEYYVGGGVKRAGVYHLLPDGLTARQAIAAAGGLATHGQACWITVIHRGAGGAVDYFPLKDLKVTDPAAEPELDLMIKAGDQLMVSETPATAQ